MKVLGIKRANEIELVDAAVKDGAVFPSLCPGNLNIACTACPHAWNAGKVSVPAEGGIVPAVSFIICNWYDARPDGGAAAST